MKVWPHFDLMLRLQGLPPFEDLTCIDLGCGAYNSDVAKAVLEIPWKNLTSVDGYAPDLQAAKDKDSKAHRWSILTDDVRDFVNVSGKEADIVLSFDVIEHLPKEDGLKFLEGLEKMAMKRIVLFLPIEPADFHRKWTEDDNKLQEHLSHWAASEFTSRGYKVEEISDCHTELKPDGSKVTFGAIWAIKDIPQD